MESQLQPISPDTEAALQQHGGPLAVCGQQGDYVVMRSDVYAAMLGLNDSDEAETLASIRRGLADLEAGRTQDLEAAFDDLEAHDES
jgi:hypothetical protein